MEQMNDVFEKHEAEFMDGWFFNPLACFALICAMASWRGMVKSCDNYNSSILEQERIVLALITNGSLWPVTR
jgi:hypothetical protein